jgi:hypothetical protein
MNKQNEARVRLVTMVIIAQMASKNNGRRVDPGRHTRVYDTFLMRQISERRTAPRSQV